jgi:hypothetical protein
VADSVRQDIIDALDARLKAILVTNGYETDIGQNVFDWLAEPLEEDDLPALIYRDTSVETTIDTIASFAHKMILNIMVAVANSTPMTTIREIIADIDKAIGVDHTFGNLALMTERISDEAGVEIDEKKYAGCQIVYAITFRTSGFNDYVKV